MLPFKYLPRIGLCLATAFFAQSSFSTMSSSSGACNISSSSSSSVSSVASPLACFVSLTGEQAGAYQVDVKVANKSVTPTSQWTVVLSAGGTDALVSSWNAVNIAQDKQSYTFANLSSNGVIAPQGSTTFGASFSYTGPIHSIPGCRILSGPINHAPQANFTATVKGASVQIQNSAVDSDGDKLTIKYDFGDGKTITYPDVWHTYKLPGVYTIKQFVNDGKTTSVATRDVTVTDQGTNHAPVGIFSYYTNSLSVVANAKASADIDGTPLTYAWDFGKGSLNIDTAVVAQTVPSGGSLVTLTVFDGELGDTIQVNVPASCGKNSDASPDVDFFTIITDKTVKVDASVSKLADSFTWDFGDGTTGTGMFATHVYAANGTYTLKLTGSGGMMSSSRAITFVVGDIPNQAPVADFTWLAAGASVHVQSFDVEDAERDPLTIQFDFGDGASIKYYEAWHTYKTPGVYTITQTVSDGKASTVRKYGVTVAEVAGNHAPVAIFSYDSSNLSTHVNGSASADIENSALTFAWDLGEGPLESTDVKRMQFTAPEGGTLVTLTVFDGDLGNTVQAFVPAAKDQSWDFLPTTVFTTSVDGSFLKVDASDSTGADSFTWDFGDGATGTGMFASHNYTTSETYTVKLHATSGMMSNNASASIVANASTNHPPVPCFSINGNNLTASLLATCSTDADWENLTFDWDFGDGGKGTGSYTGHAYQTAGTYPITLKVSDGKDTRSLTKSFTATMLPKPTRCEFRVNAEWADGYIGWVRVINQSASPVNGWNVKLTYSGTNRINNFWNTTATGSNPYSLNPESWNGTIAPGAYAEIGFVGTKIDSTLEIPVLSGLSCK